MSANLYYERPRTIEKWFNWFFGVLIAGGFGPSYSYLLQVQGRKTGRLYSTPVNVLDYRDKRFLVAPRGNTQWVRNASVEGYVWLRKGTIRDRYAVRAVGDTDKPDLLSEYLRQYKTAVQRYFPVQAGSPAEAFVAIAGNYPAFELILESVGVVSFR
jgi:deazaflavin-dependent oxidoreductase (nitroreductase family)